VTYHDAYAYFADNYGWEVVGALQPSDFADPTPSEVVTLIEQINAEGVPTIFGSEVFPSDVLAEIGNETEFATRTPCVMTTCRERRAMRTTPGSGLCSTTSRP